MCVFFVQEYHNIEYCRLPRGFFRSWVLREKRCRYISSRRHSKSYSTCMFGWSAPFRPDSNGILRRRDKNCDSNPASAGWQRMTTTLTVFRVWRCNRGCKWQSQIRGCSRWPPSPPAWSNRPTWTAFPARPGRSSTARRRTSRKVKQEQLCRIVLDSDKQQKKVCVYRPVEAVAVVVQKPSFLKKVKLDPVVEAWHFPALDLTWNTETFPFFKFWHVLRLLKNAWIFVMCSKCL